MIFKYFKNKLKILPSPRQGGGFSVITDYMNCNSQHNIIQMIDILCHFITHYCY